MTAHYINVHPRFEQTHLFPDVEILPRAEESLEAVLEEYDVRADGTLVRKGPEPFSPAWYADFAGY